MRAAACREGRLLATSFHPELPDDTRFHALFAQMVSECATGVTAEREATA